MKLAIIIVVVTALAGAIALPLGMKIGQHSQVSSAPINVRVEPAVIGDVSEIVSAPGQVQPKTKVQISAKVVARIVRLPYQEGDTVTKGSATTQPSVLVELDSTELQAQLRAVKARYDAQKAQLDAAQARIAAQDAQIVAAKVTLEEAERDLKRQKDLTSYVSRAAVETAQTAVDKQKSELEALAKGLEAAKASLVAGHHELVAQEAEIAKATDNLSYTTITSPIDGVVTRINAKEGELVVTGTMNNAGTVILEVADLSQMLVKAQIDEATVALVKKGQKAHVRIGAYADEEFEGVVQAVALDVAQQPGQTFAMQSQSQGTPVYKTEILLTLSGRRIFSGLSADVDIETETHKNVLKVPSQAVLGRPTDSLPPGIRDLPQVEKNKTITAVVYRIIDDKAVVTPVTIGASDLNQTIIKSGLKEGERVIVGPYKILESLQHDQKVKDERAATQPATTKS